MRILHCLSQLPGQTGSGIYLQAIVREGQQVGLSQAVLCGLPTAMATSPTGLDLPAENIYPVYFDNAELPFPVAGMSDVMPYPSTRFAEFDDEKLARYEAAFTKVIVTAVRNFAPDIIHSHHLWLMTALIKKLFPSIPLLASAHGTELRQLELAPRLAPGVIKGVTAVDRVLALNHEQKRKLVEAYGFAPEKVGIAGAGYRRDLFCRVFGAKEELPTFIYAGKLSRAKGVPWLLQAFSKLPPPAALWLAGGGGGSESDKIRRQATLIQGVKLLGPLSQNELAERFQRAHVLALPSFYEGLPLVLLEALACDCRVIVTDLPGIRDLVGEEAIATELISCVPLPPLKGPDQLDKEHEPLFLDNLTQALQIQLKHIRQKQAFCCEQLQTTLEETGWHQVFRRIRQHYSELAGIQN
ncbi:MAG TPA: glycosyltransferase [Proteobacteria bacterium]|nr:glycosyltransferase [Pseudomonadota bacterium]